MPEKDIHVLHEDSDIIAVNKPAGLAVHKDGNTEEYTLADWVLETHPEIKGVGEPQPTTHNPQPTIERPGIVHRLDRDTSGVLVLAKHQEAFEHLKKQFQNREVEKRYKAVVYGQVKNESGVVDRPIGRSARDPRKKSAQRGAKGNMREAVTEYNVLARGREYTLLEVRPKTGRTHQIRVHLKAINHPVLCDKLYAPKRECALGMERQALHAASISFIAPNGERLTIEAPGPPDFSGAVACIDK